MRRIGVAQPVHRGAGHRLAVLIHHPARDRSQGLQPDREILDGLIFRYRDRLRRREEAPGLPRVPLRLGPQTVFPWFNVVDSESPLAVTDHLVGLRRICVPQNHQRLPDRRIRGRVADHTLYRPGLLTPGRCRQQRERE